MELRRGNVPNLDVSYNKLLVIREEKVGILLVAKRFRLTNLDMKKFRDGDGKVLGSGVRKWFALHSGNFLVQGVGDTSPG